VIINEKTDERDAAANDHNDDERFEPLVIDQFVGETAQRPPSLTSSSPQRRLPAGVLPAPAGRTTVLWVLDVDHRHVGHCVYSETTSTSSHDPYTSQ